MSERRRKEFSRFALDEALARAGIEDLIPWSLPEVHREPSPFFLERLHRVEAVFDTALSEMAKQIVIEAFFEEVALSHPAIKIFKGAGGFVDYLIAPRRLLPGIPLLCVAEAKKDNFERGLAQCLVEMTVCAEKNAAAGHAVDVYGIVTNATGWQFYRRTVAGEVFQSAAFALQPLPLILGVLDHVLGRCAQNARLILEEGRRAIG